MSKKKKDIFPVNLEGKTEEKKTKTIKELIQEADKKTIVQTYVPDAVVGSPSDKTRKILKVDTNGEPTLEKLDALKIKDRKEMGLVCDKYAKENGMVFMGFSIGAGEPMFKKIK
jgi:hypothetical protein